MAAIKHAADSGKYLFVFFHKGSDSQTQAMRQVFDATMTKVSEKAGPENGPENGQKTCQEEFSASLHSS